MTRDQDLERTRRILRAWGAWSSDNTGCGWYSEMPGLKNVLPESHKYCVEPLTDNDALVIDEMIGRMRDVKDERPMEFFHRYYRKKHNNCRIAKDMKCSEKTVREEIMFMETFLSGMLNQRKQMGFTLEFDR
ncbi:antiterminator Q family protein [Vibrio mytili]|uniref:antiterminator Q family protein n=1 Tax=Vibrio mytili TaxID=50718 RepID=UPI002F404BD9